MDKEKQILTYMEKLKISRKEAEELWEDDQEDFIGDDGEEMTMREYLSRSDKKDIKEGCYFKGTVEGKEVNGAIVFYMPNQLGCKFGISDIDT